MKSKLLFSLLLLGISVLFYTSCSKDLSIDPDISPIDSTILSEIALKANADSIVVGSASDTLNNLNENAAYIAIPASVTKSGNYTIDALAYFGGKPLRLAGTGTVVAGDSILKLYPTNLADFAKGTYSTDSIKANTIILNGDTLAQHLQLQIVVKSDSSDMPIKDSTGTTDSTNIGTWSLTDNIAHNGILNDFETSQASGLEVYTISGVDDDQAYSITITFNKPDLSKLPITLTETTTNAVSSVSVTYKDSVFVGGTSATGSTLNLVLEKYDATTKVLNGSFSGILKDVLSGGQKTVSKGTFKAKLP